MKRMIQLLLVFALLLSLAIPALAETGTMKMHLDTDVQEVYQGDTLELTLSINLDAACDSYGYYLELDPAAFSVVEYALTDSNRVQFSDFDNQGLVVAYGLPATPGKVECKVTLQVLEEAPLGQITLEGKAAARLGTEDLTVSSTGTKVEILCSHTYDSWSQTDKKNHTGLCTRCGHVEVTEHTWDAGAVTEEATCTQSGTIIHVCTDCYLVNVAELPAQHSYENACDPDCSLCGESRTVTHQYEDALSHDAEGHYRSCTVCGEAESKTAHAPDRENATAEVPVTCTECGYIITPVTGHVHSYAKVLSADASGHWYACDGCMEQGEMEAHSFTNDCDETCDACGYTRAVAHKAGDTWYGDETHHYRVCQICEEKTDVLMHAPGEEATEFTARVCLVCKAELTAALGHHMSEKWFFDEEVHYRQCACGETAETAEHIWSDHSEDGYLVCTVCGAKTEAVSAGVWIAMGAALLIAVGCVVIVLLRRKKQTEEGSEELSESEGEAEETPEETDEEVTSV